MHRQQQRTMTMSIYLYTLRKSNSLTLEYNHNGKKYKFPVYRFKFAFGNCSWDYDGNLVAKGSHKTKITRAKKTFGDKPILIDFYGDIYFQKTADPFWFDVDECPTGDLVGEVRNEHIDTGEPINDEPFFLVPDDYDSSKEKQIVETLIKEYYPNI